jgi:hypothetical protein
VSRERRDSNASEGPEYYERLLGVTSSYGADADDASTVTGLMNRTASGIGSPGGAGAEDLSASRSGKSRGNRPARPASTIIRSLGPASKEGITPQQLQILVNLREILLSGVAITKHGRGGKPSARVLYCDADFTYLCWRKPNDPPPGSTPQLAPSGSPKAAPKRSILKALLGPANGAHTTFLSRCTKNDDDRMFFMRDIQEVRDDISSEVLRRSMAGKPAAGADKTSVVSIILAERSLDLEVAETHWSTLFHGLQVVVNYYRRILPSFR